MKSFTHTLELPASADSVLASITSADYLNFRYKQGNVVNFELDITQNDAQGFEYNMRRDIDTTGQLPRMARKFVGDSIEVVQTQRWARDQAPYQGQITVNATGLPGTITTDTVLEAIDAEHCRIVATGHLEVRLPVVGGSLEKLLEGKISESIADSIDAIRTYVTDNA